MIEVLISFGVLGIILFGILLWKIKDISSNSNNNDEKNLIRENSRLISELKSSDGKRHKLEVELKREAEDKNKYKGENKRLFIEGKELFTRNSVLQERAKELHEKLVKYESLKEKREKDFEKKIEEMNEMKKSFEDEKLRVRKEDEERGKRLELERDRIWNEHENESISFMKTICQKPELAFDYFENTSLPETFDGSLKPDFLVGFLGQYIIFDAKMSKSNDLQTYISNQVKSTTKKIKNSKNNEEIYSNVFFVVPDMDLIQLKKVFYYEDGYSFYVISKNSFEAILASYKKVLDYDLAESFDPKERENIVNLIASFDQHISKQNAINILSSVEGIKTSFKKSVLSKDLLEDVEIKKKNMRIENFKPTDLKRLIQNPEEQIDGIRQLVKSKEPVIEKQNLEDASQTFL